VYLGGIDGFNETHNGIYLDDEERCDYGIKHTDELNEYVNHMMQRMNKTIKLNLLTKSIYTL
jgi:glutamate racemase